MLGLQGRDKAKYAAGVTAVERYLRDGMKVGLGSGTTSHWFVRALALRVRDGLRIVGVPTSNATRALAAELKIPLADLNDVLELDVNIDGPDEIDPKGRMIKGGGACLLWEKIIATAARRNVVVCDDAKLVPQLGAFPLPVEVIRFGWRSTERQVRRLFEEFGHRDVEIRLRGDEASPLQTDSGNFILDCHLRRIADPDGLVAKLNSIPGVVENGLFVDIADEIVIGHVDGSADIRVL
jgi:ribose 5-phosphate isomerase A